MNYITVDLYNDFQCIADACPNTCCAGWSISIDEHTYRKMIENEEQLGVPAEEWLLKTDKSIMAKLENKRCCMLNEKNLCHVVLKLGPDYLSNTCKFYPRKIRRYGDTMEGHLVISCPEVVTRLMEKESVLFDFGEDESLVPAFEHKELYEFESAVRIKMVDILQCFPFITLGTRLFIVYKILEKAIQAFQNGQLDFGVFQPNIYVYLQENTLFSMDDQLKGFVSEAKRYPFLQQLQKVLNVVSGLESERFIQLIDQTNHYFSRNDFDEYLSDLEAFRAAIQGYHSFYTNYWVYRIFSDIIEIPDYERARENMIYIAAEFCLTQTMALASFAKSGVLDRDEYIYIISYLSRRMEHSQEFRQKLMAQLTENNIIGAAGLLMMILI